MKTGSLSTAPFTEVRHNPKIKKQVLLESISCVRHISHAVLKPGDIAFEHSHEGGYEVFYCVRGRLSFKVAGKGVELKKGGVLAVEPGEAHAITEVFEETELLYLLSLA
ncbi:MAG: cupin domain-containing protein [Deltaproteobacteria bacterium]|nr:cupin domain-containing protein [Deltaproteobacteria bacterium]